MSNYQIKEINQSNVDNFGMCNEPFRVIGRLKVEYRDNMWKYTEELCCDPMGRMSDISYIDPTDYLNSVDRTILFAFDQLGECIGEIRLRRNWNDYCFIEDVAVKRVMRGKGVGRKLLEVAEEWAKGRGLNGFMLETQDTNLIACRFYMKNNFVLGGVDHMVYSNFEGNKDIALIWYKKF